MAKVAILDTLRTEAPFPFLLRFILLMFDDDKHNLTSVTNDYVKDTLTHDGMGNVLSSTIESAKTSAGKIVSSSSYTNSGNLLGSVTQRGNTTRYGYSGAFHKMTGLKSEVTDPSE